jgi:hypothetical protein
VIAKINNTASKKNEGEIYQAFKEAMFEYFECIKDTIPYLRKEETDSMFLRRKRFIFSEYDDYNNSEPIKKIVHQIKEFTDYFFMGKHNEFTDKQ